VVDLADGGRRDLATVLRGGNAFLPPDVRILSAEEVEPAFDARRWAAEKEYRYFLDLSAVPSPFHRRYAWNLPPSLDLSAMAGCLSRVVGEHDFSSFRGQGCSAKSPVRAILEAVVEPAEPPLARVRIRGTGFLRHMVRNLVGTAVQAGLGKLRPEEMQGILEGRERSLAGPTAPPQGLFLWSVTYPEGRGGPFSS
jgi:tRNA pseudouridine38-40 synthase